MEHPNDTGYLRTADAARLIGITPGTLRNWRSDGRRDQPAFIRIGAMVLYRREEVERFAARYEPRQ